MNLKYLNQKSIFYHKINIFLKISNSFSQKSIEKKNVVFFNDQKNFF